MTHQDLIDIIRAHQAGKLEFRNAGGDWFKVGPDVDSLRLVLGGVSQLRIVPEPKGGEKADVSITRRNLRDELHTGLDAIHELAGWHADDEADPADETPADNVAHVNGLIRQECERLSALLQSTYL